MHKDTRDRIDSLTANRSDPMRLAYRRFITASLYYDQVCIGLSCLFPL